MATAPKVPPITVEQFLNFQAPPGYRAELLHGEIILSPDPKPLHHDVVMNIYRMVYDRCLGSSYHVGSRCNVDFRPEHYMPSPDIFVFPLDVWNRARAGSYYPAKAPILAAEVVSPSNTKQNVEDKTALYLRNGSLAVWVVYPEEQLVALHGTEGSGVYQTSDLISLPIVLGSYLLPVKDFFK